MRLYKSESPLPEYDLRTGVSPAFCVVLHDVAARWRFEISQILRRLIGLVQNHFACGVVPKWHGVADQCGLEEVISICSGCEEWMIHGMTHHRETGGGLVSWLTNGSNEFGDLKLEEIQDRVLTSKDMIQSVTHTRPVGLVAPCWSLPVNAQQLGGIDYVMGYNRLLPCLPNGGQASLTAVQPTTIPLATWSYDWGRFASVASFVNCYPAVRVRLKQNAVPCVVIHPADVDRGWLPAAMQRIQNFIDLGYRAVTPSSLLAKKNESAL